MTPLIFAAISDIAGKVRGKAFPEADREHRIKRGIGWTPTNVQITCFDVIAETPFGALGDLLILPDPSTEVHAVFEDRAERFMLGDVVTLDGTPWECCTRSLLKSALDRLEAVAGLRLRAAFEHEFQLLSEPARDGEAYGRNGFEAHRSLCEMLMWQIAEAGLSPDSIMKEYGSNQIEVVIGPEDGTHAADAAVIIRELTRATARFFDETATFTPIRDPASVGNGVHVHFSLSDLEGRPVTHDANGPAGLSSHAGAFSAGILKYLDSILAFTAPSVISYQRLTPHRWSAAFNNLGYRDREAALRICPVSGLSPESTERQFNLEFRAADAAASPYLVLAALVHAGAQGIEDALITPAPTAEDLSLCSPKELQARNLVRLPQSLPDALTRLEANETVRGWFPAAFTPIYLAHKRAEIAHVEQLDVADQCRAYERTY